MHHTEEEVAVKALEAERDALIVTVEATEQSAEKIAEAIAKINLVYDGLISKVNGVASATESSANRQVAALQKVVDAAGKVTAIKLPGGGVISTGDYTGSTYGVQPNGSYTEAQDNVPNYMTDEFYVPEIYKNAPSYAVGTPYVPETSLAVVHKGEAIIPANQNTNNNSFSPTININNPVVRNNSDLSSMKIMVEQVLDDKKRQFFRSGRELAPGM
jgi:superfamily II helicase